MCFTTKSIIRMLIFLVRFAYNYNHAYQLAIVQGFAKFDMQYVSIPWIFILMETSFYYHSTINVCIFASKILYNIKS